MTFDQVWFAFLTFSVIQRQLKYPQLKKEDNIDEIHENFYKIEEILTFKTMNEYFHVEN